MSELEHEHELRVLTDRDAEGIALGLVQAWRPEDVVLLKRLLVRPAVDERLRREVLLVLVDLVVPVQHEFETSTFEHRVAAGLVLARGTGLGEVFEALLESADQLRLILVLARLVAELADAGRIELESVTFADGVR